MKIASIIFIVLGAILNFSVNVPMGVIGLCVGIWAIYTLGVNRKNTACGVLCIFFTGLLGGIFYLCWSGD